VLYNGRPCGRSFSYEREVVAVRNSQGIFTRVICVSQIVCVVG